MHDITLTWYTTCTIRLQVKLHANITWPRMKLKPSKSRSISIVRGKLVDQKFHINKTPIPTVLEMPVKSLERWYNASFKDLDQSDQLREETIKGLDSINDTLNPGKLKLWCLQFRLLHRWMWPLTVYKVHITKIEKLERIVSTYIKKWLGLPRCLSNISLYGRSVLELPVSSLTEEYTSQKSLLIMELTVPWGSKWTENTEVFRPSSRSSTTGLANPFAPHRGWVQRFCSHGNNQATEGLGVRGQALQLAIRLLSEAAERSSNWLWIKRKDPKWAAKWPGGVKAEGSAHGTPGVAAEPIGGVVGLSTKHQGRRVPTWWPQLSDYPYSPLKMSAKCRLFGDCTIKS